MKIAVISDTHGNNASISMLAEHVSKMDLLIHLGDNVQDVKEIKRFFKGEIICVKGNCDFSSTTPNEKLEVIEEKKIFLTHGHEYDVKRGLLKLQYKAKEIGADIVLFGHTHISDVLYEDGIWFINPGSLALPRNGKGSIAIIELKNGEINANIKTVSA